MARLKLNNVTNGKTLDAGVEEFLSFCKVKKLSERTITNYIYWCKDFISFLKAVSVQEIKGITQSQINSYSINLQARMQDTSVNTALRHCRTVINYWNSLDYIPKVKISLLKVQETVKDCYSNTVGIHSPLFYPSKWVSIQLTTNQLLLPLPIVYRD